uniref:2-oxoglutarate-dependent dioxygenase n=1 Tax=Scoparia dulcis TaxID=107240 RepID=A0A5H2QAB9_SCODU|nr:2-oxoglutarate-dependent dioxygenase [Scoparia dulcis]
MNMSIVKQSLEESAQDYDRLKELKAFDGTKAGVKGIVDSGISKVPKIFIRPPEELSEESTTDLEVPVIDLGGIGLEDQRKKIVNEVKQASKDWGFFQVVNHGIPLNVLDEMLDGIRKFHEQDVEVKQQFYSRDRSKKVNYASNVDLYKSRAANWRDTLTVSLRTSDHLDPDELPEICRDSTTEYLSQTKKLGDTLFELLSEALGLKPGHLRAMDCAEGRTFVCHYYPPCPEPELTMGTSRHTDPAFLTIVLQDEIGGLQVRRGNQYINIPPIHGGLVINIGDMLQMVSNDEFISADHRVVANRRGPRISVACFFTGAPQPGKIYGPVKELLSEQYPARYKDFTVMEFMSNFFSKSLDKCNLDHFRLLEKETITQ